ncbi:venom carboxylesterase-6-like isoform X2 [Cylas formicarius]|uniref:venom carboxylesterase-6-like isoform X2 n=1 Tax=Cylas formicarius TaxID=197179 RepID=UPI0029586F4D|nr:venom carboxylesterase-6-like isoform X2 [Cylas formicarius]
MLGGSLPRLRKYQCRPRRINCYRSRAIINSYMASMSAFSSKYFKIGGLKMFEKLPVIFSIYGGAFRSGYAAYGNGGPEWFVENGIVFVSFNYRVGPFGFLSTGDLVVSGNAGLKDQNLALKWTRANVGAFGGDGERIVIHGQSAGGASVTYHLLSEKSRGLYRAAIAESGSALCTWGYLEAPKTYVETLAKIINDGVDYPSSDSGQLLDYLQNVSAREIDYASTQLGLTLPVLEVDHVDAFLTRSMYELVSTGDVSRVPLIIGINSEEEIGKASDVENLKELAAHYDSSSVYLIPADLGSLSSQNKTVVGQLIKEAYVGNDTFSDNVGAVVSYFSDNQFTRAIIRYGELQAKYSPVYFYEFSYKGKMGNLDTSIDGADSVGHGEEMKYLFVTRSGSYDNTQYANFAESDVLTHLRMVRMWTNFVKYLNPTPDDGSDDLVNVTWPTVGEDFYYLNINDSLEVSTTPKGRRYETWRYAYDNYGTRAYVTY